MRKVLGLLVCLAIVAAAAVIGSHFTARSVGDWYAELEKPAWTPPRWLFGPAWTALYAMMAVAAWLVWLRGGTSGRGPALALFAVQLALNVAWSGLFFGLRMPGVAFIELVVLWATIVATTVAFFRVRPLAGVLMLPYLAWTSFAGALNLAIWRLNT